MSVDASKLKRRRGLGAPPTEGAPGIEPAEVNVEQKNVLQPLQPQFLDRVLPISVSTQDGSALPSQETLRGALTATAEMNGFVGPLRRPEEGREDASAVPRKPDAAPEVARGRAGGAPPIRRQRVPPPETEPRVPFTTRVAISTKERLEDACYHLRRKHQDFINEAILAHLERHGF